MRVTKLEWGAASIGDVNDGLWDNNGRVAVHWPIFQTSFHINSSRPHFHHMHSFYIQYDNGPIVQPMTYLYYDLNDIVFMDRVHIGVKKAKVFTTLSCE